MHRALSDAGKLVLALFAITSPPLWVDPCQLGCSRQGPPTCELAANRPAYTRVLADAGERVDSQDPWERHLRYLPNPIRGKQTQGKQTREPPAQGGDHTGAECKLPTGLQYTGDGVGLCRAPRTMVNRSFPSR